MRKRPKSFSSERSASSERDLTVPETIRPSPRLSGLHRAAAGLHHALFKRMTERPKTLLQIQHCLFVVLIVALFALVVSLLILLVVNSFRQATVGDMGLQLTILCLHTFI